MSQELYQYTSPSNGHCFKQTQTRSKVNLSVINFIGHLLSNVDSLGVLARAGFMYELINVNKVIVSDSITMSSPYDDSPLPDYSQESYQAMKTLEEWLDVICGCETTILEEEGASS